MYRFRERRNAILSGKTDRAGAPNGAPALFLFCRTSAARNPREAQATIAIRGESSLTAPRTFSRQSN